MDKKTATKKKKSEKETAKQPDNWYVEYLKNMGVIVNKKGEIVCVPTGSRYSREYDY